MRKLRKPPAIKGLDFNSKEIEKTRKNRRLLSISLFTSNVCNLKCLYCYRDAGREKNNELSLEEYKDTLLQAKDLGAKMVMVPGAGEPLCDPIFYNKKENSFPLIDYANKLGLYVVFFTNGTLITEENATVLFKKDVSIITKLNSTFSRPDIQNFLAGTEDAYARIVSGLKALLRVGFNKENRLGIDSVIVKQNYSEIEDLFNFCRFNNIVPYITTERNGGRGGINSKMLDVGKEELGSLFRKLLEVDKKLFGYTWKPFPPHVAGNCKRLFHDIVVSSTGDIQICPGINISIGNIRQISLKKALNATLVQKFRNLKKHLQGKCRTCKNSECAYGCRLSAYAEGNLYGEDPQCWWKGTGQKG